MKSDLWIALAGIVPVASLFGVVWVLIKLWLDGNFFTTGTVDRPTIIPWSIGIGQIAFVLVAAIVALAVPKHDQLVRGYHEFRNAGDEVRMSAALHPLNKLHAYTAALVGLNFFVGMSAMSLDPFWWILIQDHVVLHRYPLRDDFNYPELPLWMLGSLYLILVSVFLYLILTASTEVAGGDENEAVTELESGASA